MSVHDCNARPYGCLFSWHWMILYISRHLLDRLEVHAQRAYHEGSPALAKVVEAIDYDRETKLTENWWHTQQEDIADVYVSNPAFQPREPIEFLESEPWIVEFSATRRSSDMDYLLMGGVIACFAACFASVSPVALSCCPNEPQTVLVSPVSPVEEEHRVPVLVEHPDSSVAVAYEPREAKRNKKRRCCRGDLNLCDITGWF